MHLEDLQVENFYQTTMISDNPTAYKASAKQIERLTSSPKKLKKRLLELHEISYQNMLRGVVDFGKG